MSTCDGWGCSSEWPMWAATHHRPNSPLALSGQSGITGMSCTIASTLRASGNAKVISKLCPESWKTSEMPSSTTRLVDNAYSAIASLKPERFDRQHNNGRCMPSVAN